MSFNVVYHELVVKEDIPKLGASDKVRVKSAIEKKLTESPDFFGKPLRRSLKGYKKLRVGDLRVIFRIEKRVVKIFCIDHRSVVYKNMNKRV